MKPLYDHPSCGCADHGSLVSPLYESADAAECVEPLCDHSSTFSGLGAEDVDGRKPLCDEQSFRSTHHGSVVGQNHDCLGDADGDELMCDHPPTVTGLGALADVKTIMVAPAQLSISVPLFAIDPFDVCFAIHEPLLHYASRLRIQVHLSESLGIRAYQDEFIGYC